MFILKPEDVQISSIRAPQQDQQIPILKYQRQTFRLLKVFKASQEQEALALWRNLTDNQGKACVLLKEPQRFSVWGKIRLQQQNDTLRNAKLESLIQGCILLLQAVYAEIEDLLGSRQAKLFHADIMELFQHYQFPQADSSPAINYLLTTSPLNAAKMPAWQEHHLLTLLQELHRLGKGYFGSTSFVNKVIPTLQSLPAPERSGFIQWLNQSAVGKLWQ